MFERRMAAPALYSIWARSWSRMSLSKSAVGGSLRVMAFWLAASSCEAAWSRPSSVSTSPSDRRVGASGVRWFVVVALRRLPRFFGLFLSSVLSSSEEGIVGLQVVGLHGHRVCPFVASGDGLGRLSQPPGKATLVDEKTHVPRAKL